MSCSIPVGALERWALEGDMSRADEALEETFGIRHEVLTVATVASLDSTLSARVGALRYKTTQVPAARVASWSELVLPEAQRRGMTRLKPLEEHSLSREGLPPSPKLRGL